MKNKLTTSAISKNHKIEHWFINSLTLMEERLLHTCNTNSQSSLFDNQNPSVEQIIKNKFKVLDFIKLFKLKKDPRTQMKNDR